MTKQIVMAERRKRIDESLSNVAIEDIAVLRDRYAKLCKEVLDEPGCTRQILDGTRWCFTISGTTAAEG